MTRFHFMAAFSAVVFSMLALSPACSALTWEKHFGGVGEDWAVRVIQAEDGGYVVLGITDNDIYLIKTDSYGNFDWEKRFGETNLMDDASSIQKTSDGGYIIMGNTRSPLTWSGSGCLIKTNAMGELQWSTVFPNGDYGTSAYETSDGGYIIAGFASVSYDHDEIVLMKTDEMGNIQWRKTFGATWWGSWNTGNWARQTSDGGYILAATNDQPDFILIKTFSDGSLDWSKTFGQPDTIEHAHHVEIARNGDFVISGSSYKAGYPQGPLSIFLVRTDAGGATLWEKLLSTGCDDPDMGTSVQETSDGGFIVSGGTLDGADSFDAYIVKTDSLGIVEWDRSFGGVEYDIAEYVRQTADGGYIVAGYTYGPGPQECDVYLVYYNPYFREGDFDKDRDVDGSDLAAFIADPKGVSVADFAASFGSGNQ